MLVEKCVHRIYSVKLGYLTIPKATFISEILWWWSIVWDLHVPLKIKIIFWLSLKNKLLTWDNGLHQGWVGPNRCSICNMEAEFVSHIFFILICSQMFVLSTHFKLSLNPSPSCLEDWFSAWKEEKAVSDYISIPFF
jgi:hypothetical protein